MHAGCWVVKPALFAGFRGVERFRGNDSGATILLRRVPAATIAQLAHARAQAAQPSGGEARHLANEIFSPQGPC